MIMSIHVFYATGHVEWTDATRKRCLVMWRTPAEWGKLIYSWVSASDQTLNMRPSCRYSTNRVLLNNEYVVSLFVDQCTWHEQHGVYIF